MAAVTLKNWVIIGWDSDLASIAHPPVIQINIKPTNHILLTDVEH